MAVGYDGSEASQQAVRWAAEYAATLQAPIRVIHAWVWPVFTKKLGPVKGVEGSGLRHSAETLLAEGVELARQSYRPPAGLVPGTDGGPDTASAGGAPDAADVDGVMEAGLPAQVLRGASRDARLLVIGSRGIGGVLGQLAGSVCLDLAGSSPCPVLVIRRPRNTGNPVAAGVDATPRSAAVLAGAARLATALGTTLQLVHVDQSRGGDREEHGRHTPLHGQELLDTALAEARKLAPELAVSATLVKGHAASKELLAAARDADTLVIGTHNREGGPGNTVSAVLHKARCNVLITR
ncbi:universal stress protein [Arthrobacter sp. UYCu712]|uniref:universal stress protein n=1 Tax=Arthrobacter sp. UYCu712 TaxID=3156340 RepID=UPI00339A2731